MTSAELDQNTGIINLNTNASISPCRNAMSSLQKAASLKTVEVNGGDGVVKKYGNYRY